MKAISEPSTLENPYVDSLLGLTYEFIFCKNFFSNLPDWGGQLRTAHKSLVVIFAIRLQPVLNFWFCQQININYLLAINIYLSHSFRYNYQVL